MGVSMCACLTKPGPSGANAMGEACCSICVKLANVLGGFVILVLVGANV